MTILGPVTLQNLKLFPQLKWTAYWLFFFLSAYLRVAQTHCQFLEMTELLVIPLPLLQEVTYNLL